MIKTLSSNLTVVIICTVQAVQCSQSRSLSGLRVKWRAGDKIRVSRQCWLADTDSSTDKSGSSGSEESEWSGQHKSQSPGLATLYHR